MLPAPVVKRWLNSNMLILKINKCRMGYAGQKVETKALSQYSKQL